MQLLDNRLLLEEDKDLLKNTNITGRKSSTNKIGNILVISICSTKVVSGVLEQDLRK